METAELLTRLEQKLGLQQQRAKVLIVGLGTTGLSVARFLKNLDIQFAMVDSRDKPPLIDQLADEMPDVAVFSGGFDSAAFEVATHLLVSPGVSLQQETIAKAIRSGLKVISDIDLFACAVDKPVIGVTGSNGKSTVTTLLGDMGRYAGVNTAIGGNLGIPALDLLKQDADLYVLELSSFQLERTSVLEPVAATVLNVSADHMDRHAGIEAYAAEKKRIFKGNGICVLNLDDPVVMAMQEPNRNCYTFSVKSQADYYWAQKTDELMAQGSPFIARAELKLEGLHNVANVLAAIALGQAVGLDDEGMRKALRAFNGLEHRMQKVAEINGVSWINDSKATNPGACIAALNGSQEKVVLIAGGDAKGAAMTELTEAVQQKCKAVVAMGKDAEQIEAALKEILPVYRVKNMRQAVSQADKLAETGERVLLSPACASLDQYKNYMERGERFIQEVRKLEEVACQSS